MLHLLDLPDDLIILILSKISTSKELLRYVRVNKQFYNLVNRTIKIIIVKKKFIKISNFNTLTTLNKYYNTIVFNFTITDVLT